MNTHLSRLIDRHPTLRPCAEEIDNVFRAMATCFGGGGKALFCGNGGSSADADHWSGELLKGFATRRTPSAEDRERLGESLAAHLQQGLPCLPLPNFTALLTAFANDVAPEFGFAQLVYALGRPGDVLVGISTSGNSRSVNLAVETANALGLVTIGLTGAGGGGLARHARHSIRVPATVTHEIQELHLPVYHTLCLMLEGHFFPEG